MATTVPVQFTGTPTLTPQKVAAFTNWYTTALGDADKADDPSDANEYAVVNEVMEDVLRLLYDMPQVPA